jgi:HD-GYP domain-containing protein (c-di-GMP phosphodiesterase class II)
VIDNFDIDGYHDKTDLTAQRLYTSVRSALKSYRDLRTIDLNRIGLAHVLRATRDLYRFRSSSIREFFRGVLTQIVGLFKLGDSSLLSTIDGAIFTIEGEDVQVQAGTGAFTPEHGDGPRMQEIARICSEAILANVPPDGLRADSMVLPLRVEDRPVGFVYLEHTAELSQDDRDLIQIMTNQCAGALENLRLHLEITESYDQVVEMLAKAAEYRDTTTGEHINRIAKLTEYVALELGVPAGDAEAMGKASRLHDVGKVGIPDDILQKPGQLDPEEFEVVKSHTSIGADILNQDKKLALACSIALLHHEQWGGQGYPHALSGEEIPLEARIVSVVDVFDALTHERPYKDAWPLDKAMEFIQLEKGVRFDPDCVDALARVLARSREP